MKPNRALWNRCPEDDCREEALWMPYEERCGKCGYGGKPKHSNHSNNKEDIPAKRRKPLFPRWSLLFLLVILSFFAGRLTVIWGLM
jgi:hypothetical protein